MINRSLAPQFKTVDEIHLIQPQRFHLDNGIPVFSFNAGDQELVRVEFIFENVLWDENKPLQAFATNSMLNDGTEKFTAAEIADKVDFYGAFLQTEYNFDQSTLTVFTLNKHLESVFPIIRSVLSGSVFPENELETFKTNQKQKLSVSLQKNDFISRKVFNNILFENTLYGFAIEADDYDMLSRSQLTEYFSHAYNPQNCTIILAGKVDDLIFKHLNTYFGNNWESLSQASKNDFSFSNKSGAMHFIDKKDSIQSAIRIGQLAINRKHPDFPALQILNAVLGGYFGSRLMANIREDKGYTYGIGSALVSLKSAGYFFIASEVGVDVCANTLKEIEKETTILQTELIPDDELSLVSNYMLGSLLGSLENAFSHADKFKNIYFSGLDYDYYDRYLHTVKTITSKELQQLAIKYLNFNSFEQVIVGKK